MATSYTCSSGSFPCSGSAYISQTATTNTIPLTSSTNAVSVSYTSYNSYGLPTEVDDYAYGSPGPGAGGLVRKVLTQYASLTNIQDRPSCIAVFSAASGSTTACGFTGTLMAKSAFTYSAAGNLLTDTRNTANASSTITRTFTYNPTNGTLTTATDFSNLSSHTTSYGYGPNSCGAFPDSVTLPTVNVPLSRSAAWDCTGGVPTSVTDENGQPTSLSHGGTGDPYFWRITGITPPATAMSRFAYTPNEVQVSLTNTNNYTTVRYTNVDGLGRANQSGITAL